MVKRRSSTDLVRGNQRQHQRYINNRNNSWIDRAIQGGQIVGRVTGNSYLSGAANIAAVIRRGNNMYQQAKTYVDRYRTPSIASSYGAYRTPTPQPRLAIASTLPKKMGVASGVYKGKFNKARANKTTVETKALKNGYHITRETFGIVSDPHCAYIIHNTYSLGEIVRVMSGAILRQLFNVHGYVINNRTENLQLGFNTGVGANVFRIRVVRYNPVTGVSSTDLIYNMGEGESFTTVLNSFTGLRDVFLQFFQKTSDEIPKIIQLLLPDDSITGVGPPDQWRTMASLDLSNLMFEVNVESQLIIQNRTSGALATGSAIGEADRVDNQPVVGRMYQFRHADPRMKAPQDTRAIEFNRVKEDGLSLLKASVVGQPFEEPPAPQFWTNCSKSTVVRLNPGDMKKSTIYHTYKGSLDTLVKKLTVRQQQVDASNLQLSGIPGKCQMFAFEEKIRTDSTNVLTLNYERQYKIGCTVKKVKKMSLFTTELFTQNVSNT